MSDLFATAFISILPDFSKFGAAVRLGVREPMRGASKAAGKELEGFAAHAKKAGLMAAGAFAGVSVGIAAAGAAIAYESTKMSMNFQASMLILKTQAHVSAKDLDYLSKSVLKLAGSVGWDPNSLADSLYHIESAFKSTGITGEKAMELLTVAAKGAKVGHADLVDVTNALDASVVANIPGVHNLNQAMGMLNATVGAGDMKMQDLAQAMGQGVIVGAKNMGLSLRDVSAALALFGDNNVRGANAGTMLRMSIQAMAKPVGGAKKELALLGMTTTTLAHDMQKGGLNLALKDLKDRLDKAGIKGTQVGEALLNLFGKRAGQGVNILIDQFGRLQTKYTEVDQGAKDFDTAWADTLKSVKQRWDNFKAWIQAKAIEIGIALGPAVNKFFDDLNKFTTWWDTKGSKDFENGWNRVYKAGKAVTDWWNGTAMPALEKFWKVIGPMVYIILGNLQVAFENLRKSGIRWDTILKALGIEIAALAAIILTAAVAAILTWNTMITIATFLARPFWLAWRRAIYGVIDLFGAMLIAGKLSMGWIPGIGGALDKALKAFFKFRDGVHKALDDIPKRVSVNVFASYDNSVKLGRNRAFADGGHVSGAGTGTSDSIPAWLSNGEYVVNAKATARHLPLLHSINAGHFAGGGLVTDFFLNYKDNATSALVKSVLAGGFGGGSTHGGNAANQSLGRIMAQAMYGWVGAQWTALLMLWNRESGWNNFARNPSSGAFGIPQALPPGKMGHPAVDGDAAAQIAWGLRYIAGRYGSPMGAWAHEVRAGWYDQGGILPPGLTLAMNGTGRNEHVVTGNQMLTRDDVQSAVADALREVLGEVPLVDVNVDVDRNEFKRLIRVDIDQAIRHAKRTKGV